MLSKSFLALCFSLVLLIGVSEAAKTYQQVPLPSSIGPESFAFDCNGEGAYTGVGDGRIFKWQGPIHGWAEFAVPSRNRQHLTLASSGDSTGRLMKYDPITGEVTVLLRGLRFANGVALSRDGSYLLVAETSRNRILRYWIEGPRAKTVETFLQLLDAPDNIKRNEAGEFWVALNNGRSTPLFRQQAIALRLDGEGRILEALEGNGLLHSVSEVEERNGILLVGSVAMPYVGLTQV
ncbi:hypothetical protein Sjap_015216 [Stephania japonica]|uniref:Strictosidine synthase conserved region domain-containing protein n=1 Tax=Stephania japonica TaxID=461633 RepID=A0AAP0IIQ2_9MAGN